MCEGKGAKSGLTSKENYQSTFYKHGYHFPPSPWWGGRKVYSLLCNVEVCQSLSFVSAGTKISYGCNTPPKLCLLDQGHVFISSGSIYQDFHIEMCCFKIAFIET